MLCNHLRQARTLRRRDSRRAVYLLHSACPSIRPIKLPALLYNGAFILSSRLLGIGNEANTARAFLPHTGRDIHESIYFDEFSHTTAVVNRPQDSSIDQSVRTWSYGIFYLIIRRYSPSFFPELFGIIIIQHTFFKSKL